MARKVLNEIQDESVGVLSKYRQLTVGSSGWLFLCLFETVTGLLGWIPGAAGLVLRSLFYPFLFKACGRKVVFGRGLTIRNPGNIIIGDCVVFDEGSVVDAKSGTITIGDEVFVSRGVILACKDGDIQLGGYISIGPFSTLHAVHGSDISVGDYAILGGYCYIVGGANYSFSDRSMPIVKQRCKPGKGIRIGRDCWLGGAVMVLDGTSIEDGCVIGAQSLLRDEIPAYSIAYGSPVRVTGRRGETVSG